MADIVINNNQNVEALYQAFNKVVREKGIQF
jgi:dephospho-CoA kinase